MKSPFAGHRFLKQVRDRAGDRSFRSNVISR